LKNRSDETLFLDGSDFAMTHLVERYRRPLFGFLRRWCGDAHLAEDLFQETFLKLVRSRNRFDPERRFKPYVYRVALNAAHDARATRRVPLVPLEGDALPGRYPGPAEAAAAREAGARVRAAIAVLPEAERLVVELRMYEGFTFREVAEATGVEISTAKSRMLYALRRLRPVLVAFLPESTS